MYYVKCEDLPELYFSMINSGTLHTGSDSWDQVPSRVVPVPGSSHACFYLPPELCPQILYGMHAMLV